MKFYELCIHRPIFTTVLAVIITILGILGLARLGIREYPAVDQPVISILANYRGATAEVMESQISEPIEEAVNSVAGIKTISSVIRDGAARIRLEFSLETDLDAAANDVRDQLGRAVRLLPNDADPPFLSKADADRGPVITFALQGNGIDLMDLTLLADRLKEQLQTIPEVGSVEILGEKRYSIKVFLDPDRLVAHGLTPNDLAAALRRENVELPGGRIENAMSELNIQTLSRLSTADQFKQLVVQQNDKGIVRLQQVARIEELPLNERITFTVGGIPMLGISVSPQPGANQIAIVDEAMARLDNLRTMLPEGVQLLVASDNTQFVRQAIKELRETIFIALLLVVLVIALFLGSLKVTFIPAVVIPISLIGTFFIMFWVGFSINVLTLLGLVLAVGLVVDDAIVVVENIHRRRQSGISPMQAGVEGTREVFFAVVATTLTLLAVFSPILFMQGLSGRLFREFGFVIGGAVVLSSFLALTLTPMMAARIYPQQSRLPRWWLLFDQVLDKVRLIYGRLLRYFLHGLWKTACLLLLAAAGVWMLYQALPQELAPLEDRNALRISATGPEGVSYDYMLAYMKDLETAVTQAVPEARIITTQVPGSGARSGTGVANTGVIEINLLDKTLRKATQAEIARRLNTNLRQIPGARLSISQEPSVGDRRSGNSAQLVLQTADRELLRTVLDSFVDKVRDIPEFSSADTNLKFTRPELQVALNRDRMQSLGVSATDVASALQAALSEQRIAYFNRSGRQYEIVQMLAPEQRQDGDVLRRINVRAESGSLVPLDNLVTVEESIASPQRFRFNRQSSATISARLNEGVTLAQGIDQLEILAQTHLPRGIVTSLTGAAAEFRESSQGMLAGFAIALLFVFLVLAAQFESWRAPLIIILSVPFALVGALGALAIFDQTLNIFSQIGIIMLAGLVTKNGILIVEFAIQKMGEGFSAKQAAEEAARIRFRPILMTTLSTALGILPIALAFGAGAESRASMGIAVIGGLLLGTALTLLITPAVFVTLMPSHIQTTADRKPTKSPNE